MFVCFGLNNVKFLYFCVIFYRVCYVDLVIIFVSISYMNEHQVNYKKSKDLLLRKMACHFVALFSVFFWVLVCLLLSISLS